MGPVYRVGPPPDQVGPLPSAFVTDVFVDAPAEPNNDRFQLVAAILLGLAATLTAFSAYQASLKDGEALQGYTSSTRSLNDANAYYSEATQVFALDQQLFVQFAVAAQTDASLAAYLRTLMRPGLEEAMQWWDTTDAAVTPFDPIEGNPYVVEQQAVAVDLEEQAAVQFDEGSEADDTGDQFELATVLFAITLFFGGIATLFSRAPITLALLVVATTTLVGGGVVLAGAF
jgi:hypothetical protein